MYNLDNLIDEATCAENPSSIDFLLANRHKSFQNNVTLETGLSYCHKMTINVLNRYFARKDPITIVYRKFKDINGQRFKDDLCLSFQNLSETVMSYNAFRNNFMTIVDKHAPVKKKVIRGNNQQFMDMILSK